MDGWWGHSLKRLLGDEAYFRLRVRGRFRAAVREGRPVVFVHQMGKVGSLSVLKLEMLGAIGGEAFRQFMGIEDFAPRRENAASAKPQGEIYEEFLSGLVLPEDYLDRMYGDRHSRHFYGDAEIRALRGRWGGASGG